MCDFRSPGSHIKTETEAGEIHLAQCLQNATISTWSPCKNYEWDSLHCFLPTKTSKCLRVFEHTARVSLGHRLQGLLAAWPTAPCGAGRCGHHLGRGRFKKCQCPGARDVEWFDPGWSPETNYFLFPSQAFFRISLLGISVLKTEHRTQHLSSGNQSVWCESSSGACVLHVLVPLP